MSAGLAPSDRRVTIRHFYVAHYPNNGLSLWYLINQDAMAMGLSESEDGVFLSIFLSSGAILC